VPQLPCISVAHAIKLSILYSKYRPGKCGGPIIFLHCLFDRPLQWWSTSSFLSPVSTSRRWVCLIPWYRYSNVLYLGYQSYRASTPLAGTCIQVFVYQVWRVCQCLLISLDTPCLNITSRTTRLCQWLSAPPMPGNTASSRMWLCGPPTSRCKFWRH
jgi:hypothetical protein